MGKKEQNKKEIKLNLTNTEYTAKICNALSNQTRLEILRALVDQPMTISQLSKKFYLPMSSISMHVKLLREAGLITMTAAPGIRGTQKFCSVITSDVSVDLFAHRDRVLHTPPAYVSMPVGHYANCEVSPPCGIASANFYLYEEDSPYGFYSPEHTDASLLWFTSGHLEYQFPNEALRRDDVIHVQFSFEICAEAPGYNNEWPTEIDFELNHRLITTFHIDGDYGGRRGIYNPAWWSDGNTQFGEYKMVNVTHNGCYIENEKISDETLESLKLTDNYYFSFTLRVGKNGGHPGGMNLFGKYFGDYAQDIVMKVEYT